LIISTALCLMILLLVDMSHGRSLDRASIKHLQSNKRDSLTSVPVFSVIDIYCFIGFNPRCFICNNLHISMLRKNYDGHVTFHLGTGVSFVMLYVTVRSSLYNCIGQIGLIADGRVTNDYLEFRARVQIPNWSIAFPLPFTFGAVDHFLTCRLKCCKGQTSQGNLCNQFKGVEM
jgi:hypothetical protein